VTQARGAAATVCLPFSASASFPGSRRRRRSPAWLPLVVVDVVAAPGLASARRRVSWLRGVVEAKH